METNNRLIKIRLCLRLTEDNPVHPLGYTFIQDEDQSYYITPQYEVIVPDRPDDFIWDDYETLSISEFTADRVINKLIYPGNFIYIKELGKDSITYTGKVRRILRTPVLGFEIMDCVITDELTGKCITKENFSFYSFSAARHDCDSFELAVVQE